MRLRRRYDVPVPRTMRLVLPLVLWAIAAQAAPTAGLSLSHTDALGDTYRFSSLSVVVDGAPYAARDALGEPGKPLVLGALEPGTHAITVEVAYLGRSGVFSYINGYRFRFRVRLVVQLGPGDVMKIDTTAKLRDVTQHWEDRAELTYVATPQRAVLEGKVLPVIRDPMLADGGFPATEPTVSASEQASAELHADQAIADLMKQAGPEPSAQVAAAPAHAAEQGAQVVSAVAAVAPRSCPLPTTHFAFAHDGLAQADARALAQTAACLAQLPAGRLRVEGYCDPLGSKAYNLALGKRRARSVAQFLIAQGVSADRLEVVSFGSDHPVCHQRSAACRAEDRRVELVLLPSVREGRSLRGGGTSRPSSTPRSARAPLPCTRATRTTDTPPGARS